MLNCLQINLHHSRAAALNLSQVILEKNVDVVLIQEPYATFSPDLDLFSIPTGYSSFHYLNKDHAYGAAILVKSSLRATCLDFASHNHFVGIKLSCNGSEIFLFSLYLRPSLADAAMEMETCFSSIPCNSIPDSIICCDSNAHSTLWNSCNLSPAGSKVESVFTNFNLNIDNRSKKVLNFVPSGTSFVDITLNGDNTVIDNWCFLDEPSLSDHPFISFNIQVPQCGRPSDCRRPVRPRTPPPPSFCDLDRFYEILPEKIAKLPSTEVISKISSPIVLDSLIADLICTLKETAYISKKPRPTFSSPGIMPWWSSELQILKSNFRKASEEKRKNNNDVNVERYRIAKQVYQRELRNAEKKSWKDLCSNELNSDLFAGLKKIAKTVQPPGPPSSIVHDGVTYTEPLDILKAFSAGFFPTESVNSEGHSAVLREVENCLKEHTDAFPEISVKEIEEVFPNLKKTKAPGTDGFSPLWLALSFNFIKSHILAIFNTCLKLHYFPRDWKVASVLIFKKANKASYN
jgi:hypothetical protein